MSVSPASLPSVPSVTSGGRSNSEAERQAVPPKGSASSTVAGASENAGATMQPGAEGASAVGGITTPSPSGV